MAICPECGAVIEEIQVEWVSSYARAMMNKEGKTEIIEEMPASYENKDYFCPKCFYEFESKQKALKVLRQPELETEVLKHLGEL